MVDRGHSAHVKHYRCHCTDCPRPPNVTVILIDCRLRLIRCAFSNREQLACTQQAGRLIGLHTRTDAEADWNSNTAIKGCRRSTARKLV